MNDSHDIEVSAQTDTFTIPALLVDELKRPSCVSSTMHWHNSTAVLAAIHDGKKATMNCYVLQVANSEHFNVYSAYLGEDGVVQASLSKQGRILLQYYILFPSKEDALGNLQKVVGLLLKNSESQM